MIARSRPISRVFSFVLLLLLLVNVLPMNALAADTIYEGEVELTGKFDGRFDLSSSEMEMFNLVDVVPGDSWHGKIHVKNTTLYSMEIAIISIVSNLEDLTLYDALDLNIRFADNEIYNGSYGATSEPISEFIKIPKKSVLTFDVVVTLPKHVGNYIQNKAMDSTWTFEARSYAPNGGGGMEGESEVSYSVHYVDKDGNDLLEPKYETGESNTYVTEKAPEIDGYTPDADTKTIYLRENGENKIVFVYSPSSDDEKPTDPDKPTPPGPGDDPTVPSGPEGDEDGTTTPTEPTAPSPDSGDKPTDNKKPSGSKVPTGFDMTGSNSSAMVWLIILGLCILCGLIVYARIRAEKARLNKSSNNKEASTNVKK